MTSSGEISRVIWIKMADVSGAISVPIIRIGLTVQEYTLKLYILSTEVYLCVWYGSHNKQRLFPQTALTGWAL
jgi:hypothetical protein